VMLVALDPPDFRTLSDFRKRHLKALGELFLQVVKLCETAGLVILATSRLMARRSKRMRASERAQHPTAANGKVGGPLRQLMRKKIDYGGFETPYRLRTQVVEPVFGQIKQARGFRQLVLMQPLDLLGLQRDRSIAPTEGEF
jgi:hypothetical protein